MPITTIEVTTEGQPLPHASDGYWRHVKLQARLTNSDGNANQSGNVMVSNTADGEGFELVPGVFSEWLYVPSIGPLFVRTLSGSCTLAIIGALYLERPQIMGRV